jgi:hypothetical protein
VTQTLSLASGGSFAQPLSGISAVVSLAISVIALSHVMRQSPRRACFYLTAIVLVPAAMLVVMPQRDIYPRYFLGNVLMLYLLWSELFGALYKQLRHGPLIYATVLSAIVCLNVAHIGRLIAHGRSHYREAIELVERETIGTQVNLAFDHGFRHKMVLDFLASKMPLEKALVYEPRDPEAVAKAEWFFTHSLDPNFEPPLAIRLNDVHNFKLVQHYPFAGLSGWHLDVYRRLQQPVNQQ